MLRENGHEDNIKCVFYNTQFIPNLFSFEYDTKGNLRLKDYNFEAVRDMNSGIANIFMKRFHFIPINIRNVHWAMVVVDMKYKSIHYLDTKHWNGGVYLDGIKRYLFDKWKVLYDGDEDRIAQFETYGGMEWQLGNRTDIAYQGTTLECGVYVCLFANMITCDMDITTLRKEVVDCRGKLHIMASMINSCVM